MTTPKRDDPKLGLRQGAALLGLLGRDPAAALRDTAEIAAVKEHAQLEDHIDEDVVRGELHQYVDERIAARAMARKERRFADADRIREELAAKGIILEDGAGGTTWRGA